MRERAPFVVVPILLFGLAAALVDSQGRYDLRHLDPDYNYLLNALNLLALEPPGHIDHPGTTVQLLGAVCVLVRWLPEFVAGGASSVQDAVLREPESYLRAIQGVLAALVAVAVYVAGRTAARVAHAVPAGIVLQLSALLFVTPLRALSRVTPEPLLFAGVFALLVPLLPLVLSSEDERSGGAVASGVVFGLGMVSKVTFLPLAAAAVLFRERRSRARFAIAAIVAMAAATVPIWSRLPRVASWLLSLVTHSGEYGEGAIGVPGTHQLRSNVGRILSSEPLLLGWLVFYLAALLTLRFGLRDAPDASVRATVRALGFGVLVLGCQSVMAIKHYIGPRYLLPALVATALPNAALLRFLSLRTLRAGARRSLAIGGGILFAGSLVATAIGLAEVVESDRSHRADARELAQARSRLGDCMTIGYYSSSAGDYALHFGNENSDRVHAAALERLHPGSLEFQRWLAHFSGFDGSLRDGAVRETVRRGGCVLMQGSVMAEGELKLPPGFALRELVRGRYETLSRLELSESR